MTDFEVYWQDEHNFLKSKVYYIDITGLRFLVTDYNGRFHWVSTDDCELVEEETNNG